MTQPSPDSTAQLEAQRLYEKYRPLVLRRALRFFDRQRAEDVLQEIFMKVLQDPEVFEGRSSPSTWLYRVTTNHCLNQIRDRDRRRELLREHAPTISSRRQRATQKDSALLEQLWERLDESMRELAIYYYVDGMTQQAIAEVLGVSRRTVGNRLRKLESEATAVADATELSTESR